MQEYFNVQNQISNCSFVFADTKNKGNDVIDTFETTDAFYDFSMDIGQSFTKTTLIFTNNVLTKIIGVLPNSFKDSLVGVDGLENLTLYNEIEISDIGNAQAPHEVKNTNYKSNVKRIGNLIPILFYSKTITIKLLLLSRPLNK